MKKDENNKAMGSNKIIDEKGKNVKIWQMIR